MKYVILAIAAGLLLMAGLFLLNNQSEQHEADKKWSEFMHKEDNCQAVKRHTLEMRRAWLDKGQTPTKEDEKRWAAKEAQVCGQ